MKILVTGGTGFTGSHLVLRLLSRGHQVVAVDVKPGIFHDELVAKGAEIHLSPAGIADRELMKKLVRGCEVVHHVAAVFRQVNLPKSVYWDVNVDATKDLLRFSLEAGVKTFVNCSTCGVHGHCDPEPAVESSPIRPDDYYQFTKYEGEKVIPPFLGKGMRIITLRPTAIYGPGDPERFFMLFKMVRKGRFFMAGPGTSHYHPVYIDNLVDAFELAAEKPVGDGEAYLVADDKYYSLNEIVTKIGRASGIDVKIVHIPFRPVWMAAFATELVWKVLPSEPPIFRRRIDWFRQNRAFSSAKAMRDLGYDPKVGLDDGLARTHRWYKEKGYL